MDELIDILDSEGNPLGKTAMKSEVHKMGWFHRTVHIWFHTSDGRVLLQQRGKNKDAHPLLWDVSVAGHVSAGEPIETAALREVEEEIGLEILTNDLYKIGVFKSIQKHHERFIDHEFHHTFLCELKMPLEKLTKQESEVASLKLIPLSTFKSNLEDKKRSVTYVPHEKRYYKTIINAIEQHL
ncbi:NUDIX hydrolase [Maribacter sp. 2210JD10-5]|uniref:NUDIX hydrolase n=1 Tax=Maribacter sp. 2210JD10-5 TaxID=3386272 RepID=UPI0039BC6F94